jgi:twitching motility protein PilT
MALRAVVSQHLLPSAIEGKRQLALEIMINNNPIASAIRLGKLESIDTGIVTGRADGMISLDESLRRMCKTGAITRDTAERFVSDATILNR